MLQVATHPGCKSISRFRVSGWGFGVLGFREAGLGCRVQAYFGPTVQIICLHSGSRVKGPVNLRTVPTLGPTKYQFTLDPMQL